VVFVAVDTPQGEDSSVDLSSLAAVDWSIGQALAEPEAHRDRPLVVAIKGTVPWGAATTSRCCPGTG
jgi:UDP-glucose 6-dehydrogenase